MPQIVVFMVFGDLDLDLWLLFTKKKINVSWVCRIHDKKNNLDRCQTVACRRCDRQTDKRTNGTDQYTLRKVEDFRKVIIIGYFKFCFLPLTLTLDLWLWPWPLTFELDLHSTLNVKFWRIFCDVISLLARVFIVSFDRAYKEVSKKNIENFLSRSFCDMTVPYKNRCTVRVTLTYEGQLFFGNWLSAYKCPV